MTPVSGRVPPAWDQLLLCVLNPQPLSSSSPPGVRLSLVLEIGAVERGVFREGEKGGPRKSLQGLLISNFEGALGVCLQGF